MHFPFCRRKCIYCALHSRVGVSEADKRAYVARIASELDPGMNFRTVYFGGGSPALCDLDPLFAIIRKPDEFTIELHPLDVNADLLRRLRDGGVNRISMGVQSLDDGILRSMRRGYSFSEAERAFYLIKEYFDNAGIDLIVGYPGEMSALTPRHARLAKWGLRHCSIYSLILEDRSILGHKMKSGMNDDLVLPSDDDMMNRIAILSRFMADIGLERYEISNYAVPGYECRHNLAVWNGEDYLGVGEGAHGRVGLARTQDSKVVETVSEEMDAKERTIFRLRTRNGIDASGHPEWLPTLDRFVSEGMLTRTGFVYCLTERGTEVCDSILAGII